MNVGKDKVKNMLFAAYVESLFRFQLIHLVTCRIIDREGVARKYAEKIKKWHGLGQDTDGIKVLNLYNQGPNNVVAQIFKVAAVLRNTVNIEHWTQESIKYSR